MYDGTVRVGDSRRESPGLGVRLWWQENLQQLKGIQSKQRLRRKQ